MQVLKTPVEADHVYPWIDTPRGDCGMQRFCASRSGLLRVDQTIVQLLVSNELASARAAAVALKRAPHMAKTALS
jgi:hypothetical protein